MPDGSPRRDQPERRRFVDAVAPGVLLQAEFSTKWLPHQVAEVGESQSIGGVSLRSGYGSNSERPVCFSKMKSSLLR